MNKIHCIEVQKMGYEVVPMDELRKMVGFYQPQDPEGEQTYWKVTTLDGGYFTCKTQFEAEVVSSLEAIKAILVQKTLDQEIAQAKAKEMTKEVMGMMKDLDNPILKKFMPKLGKDKAVE